MTDWAGKKAREICNLYTSGYTARCEAVAQALREVADEIERLKEENRILRTAHKQLQKVLDRKDQHGREETR